MIDTHAHLCDPQFEADRHPVIEKAFQAGIQKIIEIADGPEEWKKALTLCESYPGKIFCALGFHPHHAQDWHIRSADALQELLNSPHAVAIGEIGIDYAKSKAPPETQENTLIQMLAIANQSGKPIVLHCREGNAAGRSAHQDLFRILKTNWKPNPSPCPLPQGERAKEKRLLGVLHCFSGGMPDAKEALALRLALGVDGPVTYPKNDALRFTLQSIGLENLILETDSPYLPPQSMRGRRNDPSRIPEIAEKVAALFQMDIQKIAAATTQNAIELFGF